MKNLVVLSSGSGSNLQNIIDKIESNYLFNCSIKLVVSNKDSISLKRGINHKLSTIYFPWNKDVFTREEYDFRLSKIIEPFKPDIIVLSGWNHIVTEVFLNVFKDIQIINLHPALINTFPGNNAIQDAWEASQKGMVNQTGIMVHTVTKNLDVGEVIEELVIPITETMKYDDLVSTIKHQEKTVLINAIEKISTTLCYKGKVKNVYDFNTNLLIVHTDRVSACNHYVCDVPKKGHYLAKIANWWFDKTEEIIPNHKLESNKNSLLVQKCEVIPVEFIVRGYICGSLWKHYSKGNRDYCGVQLPENLNQYQQLPEFIITPTNKDEQDLPTNYDEILERNILTKEQLDFIYDKCYKLYTLGAYECKQRNLILVDTKYEFGFNERNEIILVDEIHTVESSRFWIYDTYLKCINNNEDPEKVDKDIIRKYVVDGRVHQVPSSVLDKYLQIYVDFYNKLTDVPIIPKSTYYTDLHSIYNNYLQDEKNPVLIISGSQSDFKHVDKIKAELDNLNLKHTSFVCSAHKSTEKLLGILNDNKDTAKIYITVAGKSNALSGVIASNTKNPVISCPPFKDNLDMLTNLQSSIQCPSNCPVMTILSPQNVAISCKRIMDL